MLNPFHLESFSPGIVSWSRYLKHFVADASRSVDTGSGFYIKVE